MSFNVNLEPGGIIWQARQHMASTPDAQPLTKGAIGFDGYGVDMATARQKRESLSDEEMKEYFSELEEQSIDNPIGRRITAHDELPSGKHLVTYLTLLNESVGIMPNYLFAAEGVRKIGRLTFFLQAVDPYPGHYFKNPDDPYQSELAAGMDILTDGGVYMSSCALRTCTYCHQFDMDDETRVLDDFGLEHLGITHADSSVPYELGKRSHTLAPRHFDYDQITAVQSFMLERFTSNKD
ncbi:MAG: hypothetical protein JWO07_88 [Candidatus Saccharibacteria bacterium]|nr:hypothetical protein [Candidatus Saccharibacteria bacterium]